MWDLWKNSQSEGSIREHIQRDHVRLEDQLIECNKDCIVNDTNETDKVIEYPVHEVGDPEQELVWDIKY